MEQDIRWQQRFESFKKALNVLKDAKIIRNKRQLNKLEEQGVIQSFEFTHELAWKVLKDFLNFKGFNQIIGSKDATRLGFREGIIQNGDIWMQMIDSRNKSSNSYDEVTAKALLLLIFDVYIKEFEELKNMMSNLI